MPPFDVVKQKIFGKPLVRFSNISVRFQIDILVFDRPPQSLGENIIHIPSPSVHADSDIAGDKNFSKIIVGKLRSLIAIEDFRNIFVERLV